MITGIYGFKNTSDKPYLEEPTLEMLTKGI